MNEPFQLKNNVKIVKEPVSSFPLSLAGPLLVPREPPAFIGASTVGLRRETVCQTSESDPLCRFSEPGPYDHTRTSIQPRSLEKLNKVLT